MPLHYQDVYPSAALLRSADVVRPKATELLELEYFEAQPATMPTARFDQHHLLLNLQSDAHRVENWRNGEHRDFIYSRHEIVVTPAGTESGWRWHAETRVIVITIDPGRLRRFVELELGVLLSNQQLKNVPQALDPDLCQSGIALLNTLRAGGIGFEVMYEALARVLIVQLIQRYGDHLITNARFGDGFTARHYRLVIDHVARHFSCPISVKDLARVAGLSTAHFARLFKATVGDSPYQFVMNYRVAQAGKLLGEADRSLIDVAMACGFADQPHFTRTFRRLIGKTPLEYREALQQKYSTESQS